MKDIDGLQSLGPYLRDKDNNKDTIYCSDVPDICKSEPV